MPLLALIFAVTMWGLNPVALRFLQLELDSGTVIILRLFPCGLIAAIILVCVGVRPIAWRDWGRILIATLVGNMGYQILANYGIKTVPASWTGMLFGLEPVFIALFAVLLAGERMTRWLIAGMIVALIGTGVLVLSGGISGDVSLVGLTLVTLSTMGFGIYTVVLRPAAKKYGPFEMSMLTLAISALPTLIFLTPDLPATIVNLQPAQWLAVAFLVFFGTLLPFAAWNWASGRMQSSTAGTLLYVQPIVAAIGGALLLNESITVMLILGGVLIIAGVAIAQFGPQLQRRLIS